MKGLGRSVSVKYKPFGFATRILDPDATPKRPYLRFELLYRDLCRFLLPDYLNRLRSLKLAYGEPLQFHQEIFCVTNIREHKASKVLVTQKLNSFFYLSNNSLFTIFQGMKFPEII